MKLDDLTKLEISEEVANKILALHESSMKEAISGNYIPKATFDDERKKSKELNALLEQAKSESGDIEELKAQIVKLKEEAKTIKETYEAQEVKRERLEAIKKNLPDDIVDVDDVISKLDIDNYTYANDKVKGLKEDIEALRKSKPHYFKEVKSEDKNANFIDGIVGLQNPQTSSTETKSTDGVPLSVQLGQKLGQLRMQADKGSQKAMETYFKS